MDRLNVPVITPWPLRNSLFDSPSTVKANSAMIFAPFSCMVRFTSSPSQFSLKSAIERLHHHRNVMIHVTAFALERLHHSVIHVFDHDHILHLDVRASWQDQGCHLYP